MKLFYALLKNKYFVATIVVLFYILLLHDTDLASLNKRKERVANLKLEIVQKKQKIKIVKNSLNELEHIETLKKFAREKYYFKKESEDIFILSDK